MTTLDDIRAIAMRLPEVAEGQEHFGFSVPVKGKEKGFAWSWSERVHPKKPKVLNLGVLVVLVRNLTEKDMLIQSEPEKFFTEPHYNGYPAVHVRLSEISPSELEPLLIEAYRSRAPKKLLAAYEASE